MSLDAQSTFQITGVAILAFLCGAGLAAWALKVRIRADERERMRVDEHFFSHLQVERELWEESRGIVFKEKWLVIRERLMYKQFPLSGWMQSERQIDGTIDTSNLEKLVGSLSLLISEAKTPFSIKSFVHQLPEHSESALSVPAPGRSGPKSI